MLSVAAVLEGKEGGREGKKEKRRDGGKGVGRIKKNGRREGRGK